MEEKIKQIISELEGELTINQIKLLQQVLIKYLLSVKHCDDELTNDEYLQMFINAKQVEGCSDRTIKYYRETVSHLLKNIQTSVRKSSTDDIRHYLSHYQTINNCSKTTIDNVRRNISSFFSWLEEEDYILKSPMKRIHKIRT